MRDRPSCSDRRVASLARAARICLRCGPVTISHRAGFRRAAMSSKNWAAALCCWLSTLLQTLCVRSKRRLPPLRAPLKVLCDTFAAGREDFGARLVLVRPDQYIAWAGDTTPPDAVGIIRRVAGLD